MEVDEPTDGIYRKPIFGPTKKMRPSRKIDTAGKSPRQVWNNYPLVNKQFAIENGPVEIVNFPIKNGDFP